MRCSVRRKRHRNADPVDGAVPGPADSGTDGRGSMSAQPIHPHPEPDRVPRNAEGIAAALDGERRMEFYRELLAAAPEDA